MPSMEPCACGMGWMGEGGLIKDGPGMAALTGDGKGLHGAILIEEGVLAFTEPAVPANASGVTVLDGGQLRLYSGSSESNSVRVHTFGGARSACPGAVARVCPRGRNWACSGPCATIPIARITWLC